MRRGQSSMIGVVVGTVLALTSSAVAAGSETDQGEVARHDDMTVDFTPGERSLSMGDVSVQDASGCNGNVCIYLTGTGLVVDRWRTTAYVSSAKCVSASFWANGVRVRQSATYCTSGAGTISSTWNSPGPFADGTQACNSWSGVSGYPCKTIQS